MDGSETFYLQDHAQVGVVGGWQLNGQLLWDTINNQQVQPFTIASPGDPFAAIQAPNQGNVVSTQPTSYDKTTNHRTILFLQGFTAAV